MTFNDGQDRGDRIADDQVIELDVASTREFFERDRRAAETGRRYPLAGVRLRAPIVPKKFFHTAGNFREHHEDLARVNWSHPVNKGIVFFQNVDAIIGPDDSIVYPEQLTRELDYELEMAIVIGKPGKFFSAEQAAEHIGGYLVFNDITARDIQRREMQSGVFSFSKAIDTFCPIGPYILTADEVDDPHDLDMELRVNGQVRQKSNTRKMAVSIPQLVAYHSPQVYSAGDLITTGTVAGVAASTDDPFANYLKPGDVVEAEIEKLGILRNPVISWRDAYGTDAPAPTAGCRPRLAAFRPCAFGVWITALGAIRRFLRLCPSLPSAARPKVITWKLTQTASSNSSISSRTSPRRCPPSARTPSSMRRPCSCSGCTGRGCPHGPDHCGACCPRRCPARPRRTRTRSSTR